MTASPQTDRTEPGHESRRDSATVKTAKPIRLGLICDYVEEGWASMDLVGQMIFEHLDREHAEAVAPTRICPAFTHRLTRWPLARRLGGTARNVDRLLNRFWDYPRLLGRLARSERFDLFHLVDHSYSQLLHELPAARTIVTCHDLDTFRCLLEPEREPRPRWFRAMAGRILTGLQKAAAVACNSQTTRDAILAHDLVPAERLHVIYVAVDSRCSPEPDPEADAQAQRWLGPVRSEADGTGPVLLHVGSTIPRKRIDVLLGVFANIRRACPAARLIKVGGVLTPPQAELARSLGVEDAIQTLPFFHDRAVLAAVYRRADLLLQPSEAEGFGLPVAEAMACGTPVLASDIPTLREVGGEAIDYAPVGDLDAWTESALALLDARRQGGDAWLARQTKALDWARRYRWTTHVDQLVDLYRTLLT